MKHASAIILLGLSFAVGCCRQGPKAAGARFGDDLKFLEKRTKVVVLTAADGLVQVAVNPDLQGRVTTSTASGPKGPSFGWINRELLSSGVNNPHINAFGGEDRLWIGPEGGQFSIFFRSRDPFDLGHWFTPPPINAGSFEVVSQAPDRIRFRKAMRLLNYSNTPFDVGLDREVRLLQAADVKALGIPVPENVRMVAFASDNTVANTGTQAWARETGALSVWILGMFNPSPATTVVIPFKPGPEAELGRIVNDSYFGKVPDDRLVVGKSVLFFKGDGRYRSKIGVPPGRALPFLGSYDGDRKVLTIVHLTIPAGAREYVNSMWAIQEDPFSGDVVNSYNDGPAAPDAKPLGPYYELESSSPAAFLKPGETIRHVHTTVHFEGDEIALDGIARAVLGVGLEDIKTALPKR